MTTYGQSPQIILLQLFYYMYILVVPILEEATFKDISHAVAAAKEYHGIITYSLPVRYEQCWSDVSIHILKHRGMMTCWGPMALDIIDNMEVLQTCIYIYFEI